MTTRLMNSAMMPVPGFYRNKRLTAAEFASAVREAHEKGQLVSSIGYPTTACFIEQLTGVRIPVSRDTTEVHDGDDLLICKLRYRIQDPQGKDRRRPANEDYEFFLCSYKDTDPLLATAPAQSEEQEEHAPYWDRGYPKRLIQSDNTQEAEMLDGALRRVGPNRWEWRDGTPARGIRDSRRGHCYDFHCAGDWTHRTKQEYVEVPLAEVKADPNLAWVGERIYEVGWTDSNPERLWVLWKDNVQNTEGLTEVYLVPFLEWQSWAMKIDGVYITSEEAPAAREKAHTLGVSEDTLKLITEAGMRPPRMPV